MNETGGIERISYCVDAAVHHVGRRHDIGAGGGMALGLAGQHGDGFVVEYIARVIDQAILSVAGIGVERDVGNHAKFGKALLQRRNHARHQTIRVVRLRCIETLQRGIDYREQSQCRHPQLQALLGN